MNTRYVWAAVTLVLAAGVAAGLVKSRSRSSTVPLPAEPEGATAVAADEAGRTVILTAHDDMTFSVSKIDATPGERLTVSLRTISQHRREIVHHNFILLQSDTPVDAFIRLAGISHGHAQHVPAALKHKVVAATDVAGADETVSATFRAPGAPGQYVYLCSVPGHFAAGMKGTLTVHGPAR